MKPFIIAEIGTHAHGDTGHAFDYIRAAKKNGAHAVKFQIYSADDLTVKDSPAYWESGGETQNEVFAGQFHFTEFQHTEISKFCDRLGIEYMATPFNLDAVRFLKSLEAVKRIKIASADLTHYPLLKAAAQTGLPVVLSTGASTISEISDSIFWLQMHGCQDLTLLHCSLIYPTRPSEVHLSRIKLLRRCFPKIPIGYSCHCPDINAAIGAAIMGAVIIEKHFSLNKAFRGEDHFHSMGPDDLYRLSLMVPSDGGIMGTEETDFLPEEGPARRFARRSIVAARDIAAGESLSFDKLAFKRPGTGISPAMYLDLLDRPTRKPLQKDQLIEWSDLK